MHLIGYYLVNLIKFLKLHYLNEPKNMMTKILPILLIFISNMCYAQNDTSTTPIDTFQNNIDIYEQDGVYHFKPILRPLVQIPGGRTPYYKYLWDFGDGHFSTQPEPTHYTLNLEITKSQYMPSIIMIMVQNQKELRNLSIIKRQILQ